MKVTGEPSVSRASNASICISPPPRCEQIESVLKKTVKPSVSYHKAMRQTVQYNPSGPPGFWFWRLEEVPEKGLKSLRSATEWRWKGTAFARL